MIDAFLAQHALLAAVAGALLVGVLPGVLAAWQAAGRGLGWLAGPAILAISLVANFQLVFYLTLAGLFRVEAFAAAGLSMLAAILVLHFSFRRAGAAAPARGSPPAAATPPARAPAAVLAVLALVSTAALAWRLASGFNGVFEAWDAVVSWNRWAQDWHQGVLPRNTYGYPQLVPAAWATTYAWLGSARIECVAKGLMALFPLGVSAVFLDCYIRFRAPAALFALALWPALLLRVFPDLVDSGYVDVPVAFFILLTAYLPFLAGAGRLRRDRAWLLAGVCAAAAVLTKQAGWLALALLLAQVFSAALRRDAGWRRDAGGALAAFILLAGPALAWQQLALWTGSDPSNFTYVTSTIYAGETPLERFWRALGTDTPRALGALLPAPAGVLLAGVLAVAALRLPEGRRCWLVAVLPYYAVWALFFSYDLRNLMPVVPLACLGLGLGVQFLAQGRRRGEGGAAPAAPVAMRRVPAGVQRALFLLLLLAALAPGVTREDLLRYSEERRLRSGDPEMNRVLLDEVGRLSASGGKIFTTYAPVASIAGLRERFFFQPERPWLSPGMVMAMKQMRPICPIIGLIPGHEEMRYLLLHAHVLPGVVDRGLASGDLRLIHAGAQLRFMEIVCPGGRGGAKDGRGGGP